MEGPDLNKPAFEIFKAEKELIKQGMCPFCKTKINENDFRRLKNKIEYSISGLCQKCQDNTFSDI